MAPGPWLASEEASLEKREQTTSPTVSLEALGDGPSSLCWATAWQTPLMTQTPLVAARLSSRTDRPHDRSPTRCVPNRAHRPAVHRLEPDESAKRLIWSATRRTPICCVPVVASPQPTAPSQPMAPFPTCRRELTLPEPAMGMMGSHDHRVSDHNSHRGGNTLCIQRLPEELRRRPNPMLYGA